MSCLEARRAVMIDPRRLPTPARSHIASCQECLAHHAAILALDDQVIERLRQTRNEGVRERVVLAHRLRSTRRRMSAAIAAAVLITVAALCFHGGMRTQASRDWPLILAHHLVNDPIHDLIADPEAMVRFRSAIAEIGAMDDGSLPVVRRAGLCLVDGELVVHVIFEMEDGARAVAFLLPGRARDAQVHLAGWTGEVRNMNGGAVGVFTQGADAVQAAVMERLGRGLSWRQPRVQGTLQRLTTALWT